MAEGQRHTSERRKSDKLLVLVISNWILLGCTTLLLLGQYQASVLHPVTLPFLLLMCLATASVFASLAVILSRLIRGQSRKAALLYLIVASISVALFGYPLAYAKQQWDKRMVPVGVRGKFAVMFGGSLMEALAPYAYSRMESGRLVMFYQALDEPESDLAAMDRHIEELELKLGTPMRSKIHWVRGSLLGQGRLSFLALALGSEQSPAHTLDRHEIAHAVLTQLRRPSADPPMILHEGWAESQSGLASATLVNRAVEAQKQAGETRIVDLLSEEMYRLDDGLAYSFGGAFVDFLIQEYSVNQFVDIYNRWSVETSTEDFLAVFGKPPSELEDDFWRDAHSETAKCVFDGDDYLIVSAEIVAVIADPYWCDTYNKGDGKGISWVISFETDSDDETLSPPIVDFDGLDLDVRNWHDLVGYKAKWTAPTNRASDERYGIVYVHDHQLISNGSVQILSRDGDMFHVVASGANEEGQAFAIDAKVRFTGVMVNGSDADTEETVRGRLKEFLDDENLVAAPFELRETPYDSGVRMGQAIYSPKPE